MKLSCQSAFPYAGLIIALFIVGLAVAPTVIAAPGGPEAAFANYVTALDGSVIYSEGYYKLANDLSGSTLVDLENDAAGYLSIIFIFDVPMHGTPNQTGELTAAGMTVVDVQKSSDLSSILNHGVVIERVSRLGVDLTEFLVDIKVPSSLFADLPIKLTFRLNADAVYTAGGVGNAVSEHTLDIVASFESEIPVVVDTTAPEAAFANYATALDGSVIYSEGYYKLANDLSGSTLVDLKTTLPVTFQLYLFLMCPCMALQIKLENSQQLA